jgi:D-alanyl-lipoteichoic acid acyltransferase DltB (MBOAT superfamily)
MTLSRFLRDYLYVPLGGNRLGIGRRYLNLIVTMLLGGLWHGASWTFVVWGGLHGLYLMINHAWRHMTERRRSSTSASAWPDLNKFGAAVSTLLTLTAVVIAWTFFRADSVSRAVHLIGAMFTGRGAFNQLDGYFTEFAWIAIGLGVCLFCPNSQQLIDGTFTRRLVELSGRDSADIVKGVAVGAALVIITMLAFVAASRGVTEFIYFNF